MAKKTAATRGVVDAAALAAADLDSLGLRFALVGGLAVGARSEPRFTRDVDFVVAVDRDDEAEKVVYALSRHGYSVDAVIEHRSARRLATARLRHRSQPRIFTAGVPSSSVCADGSEQVVPKRPERGSGGWSAEGVGQAIETAVHAVQDCFGGVVL